MYKDVFTQLLSQAVLIYNLSSKVNSPLKDDKSVPLFVSFIFSFFTMEKITHEFFIYHVLWMYLFAW